MTFFFRCCLTDPRMLSRFSAVSWVSGGRDDDMVTEASDKMTWVWRITSCSQLSTLTTDMSAETTHKHIIYTHGYGLARVLAHKHTHARTHARTHAHTHTHTHTLDERMITPYSSNVYNEHVTL